MGGRRWEVGARRRTGLELPTSALPPPTWTPSSRAGSDFTRAGAIAARMGAALSRKAGMPTRAGAARARAGEGAARAGGAQARECAAESRECVMPARESGAERRGSAFGEQPWHPAAARGVAGTTPASPLYDGRTIRSGAEVRRARRREAGGVLAEHPPEKRPRHGREQSQHDQHAQEAPSCSEVDKGLIEATTTRWRVPQLPAEHPRRDQHGYTRRGGQQSYRDEAGIRPMPPPHCRRDANVAVGGVDELTAGDDSPKSRGARWESENAKPRQEPPADEQQTGDRRTDGHMPSVSVRGWRRELFAGGWVREGGRRLGGGRSPPSCPRDTATRGRFDPLAHARGSLTYARGSRAFGTCDVRNSIAPDHGRSRDDILDPARPSPQAR